MSQGLTYLGLEEACRLCYLLQQKMHMPCRPSIADSLVYSLQSGEPTVDCLLSNSSDSEDHIAPCVSSSLSNLKI
jgi:hypothetical protein